MAISSLVFNFTDKFSELLHLKNSELSNIFENEFQGDTLAKIKQIIDNHTVIYDTKINNVNSTYRLNKYIESLDTYVAPIEICLSNQHNNTYQYVPILDTLKVLCTKMCCNKCIQEKLIMIK